MEWQQGEDMPVSHFRQCDKCSRMSPTSLAPCTCYLVDQRQLLRSLMAEFYVSSIQTQLHPVHPGTTCMTTHNELLENVTYSHSFMPSKNKYTPPLVRSG